MKAPFVDFKPAEYHVCKGGDYVSYYVFNPADRRFHRKQIKLNKIKDKTERRRYGLHLCHAINNKLYTGWNPYKDCGGIKGTTISEGIAMFIDERGRHTRDATMVSYRSMSNIFLEWLRLNDLGQTDVNNVTEKMMTNYIDWFDKTKKLGNSTFNNYIVFLNTVFKFFEDRRLCEKNPMPKVKKRRTDTKKRTTIPPDVRKKIWAYYQEHCKPFCIVMLLCYKCLIRPKEIVSLKMRNIDWENHTLTIMAEDAKNHKERTIAMPDDIMEYFLSIVKNPASWYIFTNKNKFVPGQKRIPPTRISDKWSEMRDAIGLDEKFQFYSLKDTGITEMLEAGIPPKYVKELADHSSLKVTDKYIHDSDRERVLKCEMLNF